MNIKPAIISGDKIVINSIKLVSVHLIELSGEEVYALSDDISDPGSEPCLLLEYNNNFLSQNERWFWATFDGVIFHFCAWVLKIPDIKYSVNIGESDYTIFLESGGYISTNEIEEAKKNLDKINKLLGIE